MNSAARCRPSAADLAIDSGESSGEVVIFVGGSREGLERRFSSVEHAATVRCRYCMPYENDKPIWVARGPREAISDSWPQLKHYD